MPKLDKDLSEWSLIKKLSFWFFFIFFSLYIFLNPNELISYSHFLHRYYAKPFANFVGWIAKDILHIVEPAVKFYSGTADTVFSYVAVLLIVIIAIIGSLIWIAADRKSKNFNSLYNTLNIILRYYLALTLIAYGSFKIVRFQFPPFSPGMLLQSFGNATPRELAWSFMGFSDGYNFVIGITECMAGVLLFFRKTSLLGSVISLALLINVVAFNYSFDINVKLLTTVLLTMNLFLLSKDIVRFNNFFFLNKIVYPTIDQLPYFKKKKDNMILLVVKCIIIGYILFFDLREDFARTKNGIYSHVKQPLYGIYNVIAFIRNKDTIKPLTTDTTRWKKLIISSPPGSAGVMFMNDSLKEFTFKPDTGGKKITLLGKSNASDNYNFIYSRPNDSLLVLRGKWHTDSLEIRLLEYDLKKFPLMKRGFRWIIDQTYKN